MKIGNGMDKDIQLGPLIDMDATEDMLLFSEETFGPVAPIFKFETEDQAIKQANNTEFGLASYFFTQDLARAWRVGEKLEFGMVGINTGLISNISAWLELTIVDALFNRIGWLVAFIGNGIQAFFAQP